MKTNNPDQKKIEDVLNSIHQGYDKLEKIEEDLTEIRKKREEIIFTKNHQTNLGDKE